MRQEQGYLLEHRQRVQVVLGPQQEVQGPQQEVQGQQQEVQGQQQEVQGQQQVAQGEQQEHPLLGKLTARGTE